jgi:hypothetical protein
MVKDYKMRKGNVTYIIILCTAVLIEGVSYASNSVDLAGSNPFLNNTKQPSDIEPKGVNIYSFSQKANKITELLADKMYIQEASFTEKFGFAHVNVSRVRDFKKLIQQYKDHGRDFKAQIKCDTDRVENKETISPLSANCVFKAADLSHIIRGESVLIFESLGGNFHKEKGWDSLTRIIETKQLGNIIINVRDFSLSNGGVAIDKDAVNFAIHGHPGILIVRENELGNAETVLSWADNKKSYTIELDRNVDTEGLIGQLQSLAELISE